MWVIDKSFEFCYGHRVWTQKLNEELSCNVGCKCKHLHGHQGTIKVHLRGSELDERGMFVDFNELNWFKKWVDDTLDHKMILDINDPALKHLFPILDGPGFPDNAERVDLMCQYHSTGHYTIWQDHYQHAPTCEREIYEGLILVPFVPTSENLSKWIFEIIQKKMLGICEVHSIEFFETPKSRSVFYND